VKRDVWFGIGLWSTAALVGAIVFPELLAPIASAWTMIILGRLLFELEDVAHGLTLRRSEFDEALATQERELARPPDLIRLEGVLGWGTYDPREFDHHVRPLLRELINHRSRRSGSSDPLPAELNALAGRDPAETIYDRSIKTADLDRITRSIERL
jgi:hypothetical protein